MRATNTVFDGGVLDISDATFENCTFNDCTLLCEGGGWTFKGQTCFRGSVKLRFGRNDIARQQFANYVKAGGRGDYEIIDAADDA